MLPGAQVPQYHPPLDGLRVICTFVLDQTTGYPYVRLVHTVIMPGSGGARKLRVARPGGGKSSGYRVISYFAGQDVPVFLLTVFPKNMKSNLTKAEQNAFSRAVKLLTKSLGERHGKARI